MRHNKSDEKGERTVFFLLIFGSVLLITVLFAASGIKLRKGGFSDFVIRSLENPGNNLRERFEGKPAEHILYDEIRDADMPVKLFVQDRDEGSCIYLCSGEYVSVYDSGGLNPADADDVLKKLGTEEIEYLVSIASSEEQLSELSAIEEKYRINNLICRSDFYSSESGRNFIESIKNKGGNISEISSFMELETAELRMELSSCPDNCSSSLNLLITSGNFSCLFNEDSSFENGTLCSHNKIPPTDVTIAVCSETLKSIAVLTNRTDSGCTLICPENTYLNLSRKDRRILRKAFEEVIMYRENSGVIIHTDGERYSVSPDIGA